MWSVVNGVSLVAVSMVLGACATSQQRSPPSSVTPVAITDLKGVAGKWEGLGQGPSSGSVLGGHSAVMYLVYDQGGKRVLRLQGQLASGGALSAELTPAR